MNGVRNGDKPEGLAAYRKKRDPGRTNEPFSPEPLDSGKGTADTLETWVGGFVVHEHDASRRHFDLRLEVSGVLKSFAVPRGPSLNPGEKRLSVQTEDHPLEYLDYEGIIPEKNYGAGAMIAWDIGRVRYLEQSAESGIAKGKLDFELQGHKLLGRFALVLTSGRSNERVRQKQWLLLKKRDAFARAEGEVVDELPLSVFSGLRVSELATAKSKVATLEEEARSAGGTQRPVAASLLVPMACSSDAAPLESDAFLYELKLDGVRMLVEKRDQEIALYYRKGRVATLSYPDIVRAMRALPFQNVLFDGEIVAFSENGRSDFQRLAQRFQATHPREVERVVRTVPVSFVAFDMLSIEEIDLMQLPLYRRKALLKQALPQRGVLAALDHLERDGRVLFEFCRTHHLEGVVAKRRDSLYRVGPKATRDWTKLKVEREDDFVVVGYTRGNVGRELGALDLGSFSDGKLISRGKVGSGLSRATEALLLAELAKRKVERPEVTGDLMPAPRGRTFVRPELVVNVRHAGFTNDGNLRHPVFAGLRSDVSPQECTAGPRRTLEELRVESGAGAAPEGLATRSADQPPKRPRFVLSNPKKIFWPGEGYTKADLFQYYEAMAPYLLPMLRERPVILLRYPDGIEGKSFYQWNAPHGTPSWVRTVKVHWEGRGGKEVELFLIDALDTLRYIVNLGCIPLHILASRMAALSTCDFLTIDFDLGGQPLSHAVTLARELHTLLEHTGLRGYPKTSGQTGLHVLVPLGSNVNFNTARALCELLGSLVAARYPELATLERTKTRRGPRVYIDTGQTGTLRAIVAPYSVRAFPGGRVSTPLSWDEISFALEPARYTLATVPERVERIGNLMQDFLDQEPDIGRVVSALKTRLPAR